MCFKKKKDKNANDASENEVASNLHLDIRNLKLSLDMAKTYLRYEVERFERLDNKFNFILVFLAALIAGLNLIFPLPRTDLEHAVSLGLLALFFCLVLSSGTMVVIGLYPKPNSLIDPKELSSFKNNSLTNEELLKGHIANIKDSIDTYSENNEKKGRCMKKAFFLSIGALFVFFILLLIKLV